MKKNGLVVLAVLILLSLALHGLFYWESDRELVSIQVDYRGASPFFRTFASSFTAHFIKWWGERGRSQFGMVAEPLRLGEEFPFLVIYLETNLGPRLIWRVLVPGSQNEADLLAQMAVSATAGFLEKYLAQGYV